MNGKDADRELFVIQLSPHKAFSPSDILITKEESYILGKGDVKDMKVEATWRGIKARFGAI